MIGTNFYKAPPFLLDKMNTIYSLLWQGKTQYEEVATAISDKDLRSTMLTLAQESNQYASELYSQINTLGGAAKMEKVKPELREEMKELNNENEIVALCKINEKNMIVAYQEILNEPFLFEGLRKMIRYQMNEMLCTFMQVKQLGSLKFH